MISTKAACSQHTSKSNLTLASLSLTSSALKAIHQAKRPLRADEGHSVMLTRAAQSTLLFLAC